MKKEANATVIHQRFNTRHQVPELTHSSESCFRKMLSINTTGNYTHSKYESHSANGSCVFHTPINPSLLHI